MRWNLKLRRVGVIAVVALTGAAVAGGGTAVAAPSPLRGAAGASVHGAADNAERVKKLMELRKTGKRGPLQLVALHGTTASGAAADTVCDVYFGGPLTQDGGRTVLSYVDVYCNEVVFKLQAEVAMGFANGGFWFEVPGSYTMCTEYDTSYLGCVSRGPCYGLGAYYEAYASLYGRNYAGAEGYANYYNPPRWVSCQAI